MVLQTLPAVPAFLIGGAELLDFGAAVAAQAVTLAGLSASGMRPAGEHAQA